VLKSHFASLVGGEVVVVVVFAGVDLERGAAAARIQLMIILPCLSQASQYLVAVTRDQNGNGIVAKGASAATATELRKQ
jgi:hypothetical protein